MPHVLGFYDGFWYLFWSSRGSFFRDWNGFVFLERGVFLEASLQSCLNSPFWAPFFVVSCGFCPCPFFFFPAPVGDRAVPGTACSLGCLRFKLLVGCGDFRPALPSRLAVTEMSPSGDLSSFLPRVCGSRIHSAPFPLVTVRGIWRTGIFWFGVWGPLSSGALFGLHGVRPQHPTFPYLGMIIFFPQNFFPPSLILGTPSQC